MGGRAARKPVRRATAEQLAKRREKVWQLWVEGNSQRSIARGLKIDLSQVQDDLAAVRNAADKAKSAAVAMELLERLTEGHFSDLVESYRISQHAEKNPNDFGVDYRSIASERANRAKIRAEIARINNLVQVMLKLDAGDDLRTLLAQALALGKELPPSPTDEKLGQWLCPPPPLDSDPAG